MWNYRIIKREVDGQPDQYGLFEVFYNDNGEITAHADEAEVIGDNPEEILESIMLMQKDAQKSLSNILEMDKIKFAPLLEDENDWVEIKDIKTFLNENEKNI